MASDLELLAEMFNDPSRQEIWALDGSAMLEDLGLDPDPWQVDLLRGPWKTDAGEPVSRAILLCSRQSGKSTVAGALALQTALLATPDKPALVLILSASGRQSKEFFKTKVLKPYLKLGRPEPADAELTLSLELANGSRIISLPTSEDTIVGYSSVTLLIIDEAARVPDSLYKTVRPMLAVGGGRLVLLSTPRGKHGFFYDEWHGQGKWKRVRKTAEECPRITKEFLAEERLSLQEAWFRQEYQCAFEAMEGLVYPEFEATIIDPREIKVHRAWAGCDFGWNNPSAFVVVVSDADDVLYVVEEIYGSQMTDEELAARGSEACRRWQIERVYCDSANPQSIQKLRLADVPAIEATKSITDGIRAVGARLRTGRLFCFRTCQNLIREMGLYHYDPERKLPSDQPVKEHDHSADALRYCIMGVDLYKLPQGMKPPAEPEPKPTKPIDPDNYTQPMPQTRYKQGDPLSKTPEEERLREEQRQQPTWRERLHDERLWDRIA